MTLKIHIAWNGEMKEENSFYNPNTNEIFVNPYYCFKYSKYFWVTLIHEVGHWLICKICKPRTEDTAHSAATWVINNKWDDFEGWFMDNIMFWIAKPWLW